ncbi:phosphocarrier protein HPr [Tamaricihabitans halophyticus]|uniref:Phosphocarrier protein HPr n=1 Tax=Tamaricihabitans halophyticus TaxID=1262583 RepID=A0A4R2R3E1_9PSEU|nr:HPr family phosphocarrier protein [Tamaricihabitans halophyticus]TCP54021.1 phosphocarrier protein HPr [Tamaricihabitans halophyticus]
MPEARVKIASEVGLHARPAAVFVKSAAQQGCGVSIGRPDGELVDATSILAVLGLAIGHNEEIVLRTEGEGAENALTALSDLLTHEEPAAS